MAGGATGADIYTFNYAAGQSLNSPFNGASFGTTTLLTSFGTGAPPPYAVQYAYGEMTQMTTPLGATLQWQHRTFTYATGVSVREVQNRFMTSASVPGATTYGYYFDRDDGGSWGPIHQWAEVWDATANVIKIWAYNYSGPGYSLPYGYWELRDTYDNVMLCHGFTWGVDTAGNWYVGTLTTALNPGHSYGVTSATTQIRDIYGNIKQSQVYDYGSSSPNRTYNYTYLHETDSNYLSRYIRNRVKTVTVSGITTPLVTNYYDSVAIGDPCYSGLTPRTGLPRHDDSYDANFLYRGNLVEKYTMLGSGSPSGRQCWAYETTGVMTSAMDGAGRYVNLAPDASTNYSLPGLLTPGGNSSLSTSISYTSSWQVTSVSGPNGAAGTTTYDAYGRPLQTQIPDGAQTNYTYAYYPATSGAGNQQTATLGTGGGARWKRTTLDGFGRVTRVETGHDSTTVSIVDTQYGAIGCAPTGKMTAVSQPYAPGGSPVWTSYTYDPSGRPLAVTAPDGSVTSYSYVGNQTTVTDPAGKWKTSVTDAMGNLIQVIEPDPAGGSLTTTYTYDSADRLVQVSMPRSNGTQTRTFGYTGTDMTAVTNPENGTVTYQYDGSHHVTTRTDALGQQTRYTYDNYGRLTEVQHWATSWDPYTNSYQFQEQTAQRVDYYYDSNPINGSYSQYAQGRLAAVTFTDESPRFGVNYQYSYNQAGRVTSQHMDYYGGTHVFDASYTWDNEGRMTGTNYGPQYSLQYDVNGRLSGMLDAANGNATVATANYGVAGEMLGLSYFGYSETRTFNSLLQMTRQTVSGMMDMQYVYQNGQNNGRIVQSIDGIANETVTYTYDPLNRLSTANATNASWGQAFTYDGFGNLTGKSVTQGSAPALSVSYDPATNHQTGQSYDANGNLSGYLVSYDIENRMIADAAATYGYDHAGKRISKITSTSTEIYFYGISGQKLATYANVWICGTSCYQQATTSYNVYFGGKLVKSKGVVVATDRLGSVRANANGEFMSYYPYGEERTSTADNREKFGTYTRDSTMQDYADQRYYAVGMGRFNSADPSGRKSVNRRNPSSWNLFSYGLNDPIGLNDPQGLNADECDAANPDEACYAETCDLDIGCDVVDDGGGDGSADSCENSNADTCITVTPDPDETDNTSDQDQDGQKRTKLAMPPPSRPPQSVRPPNQTPRPSPPIPRRPLAPRPGPTGPNSLPPQIETNPYNSPWSTWFAILSALHNLEVGVFGPIIDVRLPQNCLPGTGPRCMI
uniref:YD repeat protein n=1 Tax=Solibacter usitatus (strain Ellin6076) TaxID=234267 RepID=Q024R2_SOLUE